MSEGFWYLAEAGKRLAHLHCDFDSLQPWPVEFRKGGFACPPDMSPREYFYVEKMKFGQERSEIIYNNHIVIHRIPEKAWEYEVNGKPAVEWVMNQQKISVHKDSRIENNPNSGRNPDYPLRLLAQVIRVSIETMEIIHELDRRYNWNENTLEYTRR